MKCTLKLGLDEGRSNRVNPRAHLDTRRGHEPLTRGEGAGPSRGLTGSGRGPRQLLQAALPFDGKPGAAATAATAIDLANIYLGIQVTENI